MDIKIGGDIAIGGRTLEKELENYKLVKKDVPSKDISAYISEFIKENSPSLIRIAGGDGKFDIYLPKRENSYGLRFGEDNIGNFILKFKGTIPLDIIGDYIHLLIKSEQPPLRDIIMMLTKISNGAGLEYPMYYVLAHTYT